MIWLTWEDGSGDADGSELGKCGYEGYNCDNNNDKSHKYKIIQTKGLWPTSELVDGERDGDIVGDVDGDKVTGDLDGDWDGDLDGDF